MGRFPLSLRSARANFPAGGCLDVPTRARSARNDAGPVAVEAVPDLDPQAVAKRVAAQMFANDRASAAAGIELHEVKPGFARVSMRVRDDMLNGHGKCHGGLVFTLADTAFAFACNSRNDVHVALQCSISFSGASVSGDVLTAVAQERTRSRKTGVYDVTVTGPDDDVRALFRGISYGVGSKNVEFE